MSKNSTLNKALKRGTKALRKTRNPIDKIAKFSTNTSDIAHRVVRGSVDQARIAADSVVDIAARRMEDARKEKKMKRFVRTQLDQNASDVRTLVDAARNTVDLVTDGIVDTLDEASNSYSQYQDDRDAEKAERKAAKRAKREAKSAPKRASTKKAA